jgi:hypothetical protein
VQPRVLLAAPRNRWVVARIGFVSGVGGTRRSMWQLSPAFRDGALFMSGPRRSTIMECSPGPTRVS